MLFEIAPEDSAHRVTEALIAAEAGDVDAHHWLTDAALVRLRADAERLVNLVPYAFLCLTEQLAVHPRTAVRIDAVRYATLLVAYAPEHAVRLLGQLSSDRSRGVARAAGAAAASVMAPAMSAEPLSSGDMVEVSPSQSYGHH